MEVSSILWMDGILSLLLFIAIIDQIINSVN